MLQARGVDEIVIAARGTSDHAAIYAQYVLGARLAMPVALAAPSIVTLYGVEPKFGQSAVVGISQSGESPDVVAVVAAAARQGAPTIAITNSPDSPLGRVAAGTIAPRAGEGRAVAATKPYTAELTAIALLALALGPADPGAETALAALPSAMTAALEVEPAAERIAAA